MGFNKKFLNIASIYSYYKIGGIEELQRHLSKADAIIASTDDCTDLIVDKIGKGDIFGANLILEYELRRQGLS